LPHGSISGKVADSSGNPVGGVQVQVIRLIAGAVPMIQPVGWAVSTAKGEYRIADIAPGLYYLLATPPGDRPAGQALAPAYFPDGPDLARAIRISAPPGVETTDLDLVLHPARFSNLRGRVVTESGDELDSPRLVLTPRIPGCTGAAELRPIPVDKESGVFIASGVPPGEYVLTATAREFDTVLEGRSTVEVADSDVNDIAVVLTRGVPLSGRIAVEGQHITDVGKLQITMSAMDAFAVVPALSSSVSHDALEFRFDRVTPGTWALEASGLPANAYIKSVSIGGRELPDPSLEISLVPPGELQVTIGTDAGHLEGLIKGLPAMRQASVVMLPADQRPHGVGQVRTAVSDASGRFAIDGVAPGDYRLFAFEEADVRDLQDSAFLDHFGKSAVAIHIGPRATVSVEISAVAADAVSAQSSAGL
jgi:Carboxypeptidase regulatory-like domain